MEETQRSRGTGLQAGEEYQSFVLPSGIRRHLTKKIGLVSRGLKGRTLQKARRKAVKSVQVASGAFALEGPYSLAALAETYGEDENLARAMAAEAGINIRDVAMAYGKSKATGWALGKKHGEEEAAGKRAAPGAMKLAILKKLHGTEYILGRQRALTKADKHGGTRSTRSASEAVGAAIKTWAGA